MASKPKRHRAMGDEEWLSRLRRFATTGVWPADAGNRPAPKQKKWHDLFQKIGKCPLQHQGQMSLFGGAQVCTCGFHTKKTSTSAAAAGPAPSSPAGSASTSGAIPSAGQVRRKLTPEMFVKPRFGGSSSSALKPNLSLARKPSHPPSSTVTMASPRSPTIPTPPSNLSTPSTSPAVSHPVSIPKAFIRTISPFSLPPSCTSSVRTTNPPATEIPSNSADFGTASSAPVEPLPVVASSGSCQLWLPEKMKTGLPVQDRQWIASTLWRNQRLRGDLKLWYEPPTPSLIYHQVPTPERFFCHRLLVWMPYHLWKIRVFCPKCRGHLIGGGIHKRVRKVVDIDRNYLMITETLKCSNTECKTSYLSSGNAILDQLDLPHRSEFCIILTRKYACDIRVIRLMRERTLGNSCTRLAKQLKENHSEEWLQRLSRYFGDCADFMDRPSLFPVVCQEPPEPVAVPTNKWLMTVYAKDIMSRMDHIKARITFVFGYVLKMDSTKKITRKLSGAAKGTALWVTSVGNELGQILISVLTAQEGPGLDVMVVDLIRRYSQAAMPPPKLLYVDTGCCMETGGQTKLQKRFGGLPDLNIRLDIYHFMRRLAAGCTTDAHPLYPIFMARLSVCIFEWDTEDVTLLRRSKRLHLQQEGVPGITDAMVDKNISKEELALHCRRRTRGQETTIRLIDHLLQELMGEKGKDLLGVPLLDRVRMEHIWYLQKRHVKCIQDVPGVAPYTETGTMTTNEGLVLKNYRCARGSTSLESFHLHLNRYKGQQPELPAVSARRPEQVEPGPGCTVSGHKANLLSYSGDLVQSVNANSLKVLHRKYVPSFYPPPKYTGELIGIDYLYRQTGQALQDMNPDSEETDELLEDLNFGQEQEDEGFEDQNLDPTVGNLMTSTSVPGQPATSSTHPTAFSSSTLPTSTSTQPAAFSTSTVPAAFSASTLPTSTSTQPAAFSTSTQPAALSTSTLPAAFSASTLPTSASTQPAAFSASTLPAAFSASTLPAAFSASTLPAAFSASTLPAALSVSTQSAAFSASTLPAAFSASTHPAAFSASTQPVTFSASTQPTSASTQSAAFSASTLPTSTSTQSAAFSASTLPTSASTQSAAFSASTQPTSASIQHVDEHNMPRMDRVDTLAEYLVSLRNHTGLTLSNEQVSTIIGLWQNLLPFDQQRVVFAARHQDRLIAGKFRSPKLKAEFTAGVESLKQCVLGSTASPAQWPDCCRLVETIFVRLCRLHKNPKKQGQAGTLTRWTLILQDYRNIRQLILGNGAIMQSTTLQLVEVNQTTLIQWHNKRVKRQDVTLLLQGMNLPGPLPLASEVLPPANIRPAAPPQTHGSEHVYNLPPSTAGQAKTKWQGQPATSLPPHSQRPSLPPHSLRPSLSLHSLRPSLPPHSQ
ncbi:unnamed protein product [Leuciscus chuanchicus]